MNFSKNFVSLQSVRLEAKMFYIAIDFLCHYQSIIGLMFDQRLLFMFVFISVLEVQRGGRGRGAAHMTLVITMLRTLLLGMVIDQFVPIFNMIIF